MVSDEIEILRSLKSQAQEERARRRELIPKVLESCGVGFSTHNQGAHLRVTTPIGMFDYWPGPDKWQSSPVANLKGSGVERFLSLINPHFLREIP